MNVCSLHNKLEIVAGDWADYKYLACHHYRDTRPVGVKAIFSIKPGRRLHVPGGKAMGVIVYAMPVPRMEQRNAATGDIFKGFDRQTQLGLINRNIRCISRVIIEPRLRGIGLATRLVRETMPRMNVPIIEALGVMPLVNPFLEKAGMKAFAPRIRPEQVALIEAFSVIGIEEDGLIDSETVQHKLEALCPSALGFIETRVQQFLKSHGCRRSMPPGIERTRYILSKLAERPVYHIWFHPTLEATLP